ncbi:hypothetical protein WA026_017844 [Henosepilachna vigintioctopunctata]|uniref:E3 ubiquitin-protein ligase n=1 Tax=Henosepilachna vigintioctopunctata TaxID=420089 RepID=A0AAW1TXG5_9CUCU
MDNNQEVILEQLECPLCTDYMTIPIKQCETGHSICEKCIKRLDRCVLCRSRFTQTRNYTLEALALKIKYPCANKDAGCTIKLLYTERESHERMCYFQTFRVPCQMRGCSFVGDPAALKYHWKGKTATCNIFGAANKCSAKIKSESYFVNLVEAFNELFWFKTLTSNNRICFAMQLIGKSENANKFFYQIKFSHELLHQKKMILSDYCKGISLSNGELFTDDMSIVVDNSSLARYVNLGAVNATLNYDMRVFRVNGQKGPNNRYRKRDNNQTNQTNRSNRSFEVPSTVHRRSQERNLITRGDDEDEEVDNCCIIL